MSDAGQRPLPPVFDGLVILLTVQAHLFAGLIIAANWGLYRSGPVVVALCALSTSIPLVSLAVARRTGGVMSGPAVTLAAVALLVVDAGGMLSMAPADLGSPGMWTWGAVGVSLLTLAPFRPARDILLLGGLHGVVVLACMSWVVWQGGADAFRVLADLNAAVGPALAAAQFVALYVDAVRRRERAASQLAAAEARTQATMAIASDTERRLAWLREETLPLLEGVASGEVDIDSSTADVAYRLSRDLRSELVQARTGVWMMGTGDIAVTFRRPVVLDPGGYLGRLAEVDRISLTVLVDALQKEMSWERVSVALTASDRSRDDDESQVMLTVVAVGGPAESARADHGVRAAAKRLSAGITFPSPHLLVVATSRPLQTRPL